MSSALAYRFAPLSLILALMLLLNVACASSHLRTEDFQQPRAFRIDAQANIPNTEQNRAVLETVNTYRQAMVRKDLKTLASLIASNYYENASTTDDLSDDYGNERLPELLHEYLGQSVREMRYAMEIKQLTSALDTILVDYQYDISFRYEYAGREYWHSKNDVNRLTLVWEDDTWKIAGGL